MNPTVISYLIYIPVSVALTVWVARTLFKNGQPFLDEAFGGDERLARSVNHLLVVGFYLVNFGYMTLNLQQRNTIADTTGIIEALSIKVGLVLLVLGAMHFFNLYVFSRIRKKRYAHSMLPPVAPNERLQNMQADYCGTDGNPSPGTA